MRILFLTNFYPPHEIGGYEQWCQAVVDDLKQRGHLTEVITSNWQRNSIQSEPEPHVHRVLHLQADLLHYDPISFFTRRRRLERENHEQLRRMVRRFQPDIAFVWGMWNLDRSLPGWLEQQSSLKAAYFVSDLWPKDQDMHEIYWQQPTRRRYLRMPKRIVAAIVRLILRGEGKPVKLHFHNPITVSQFVRDDLVAAGFPFDKATVIHGGCEPELFPPRPSQAERTPGSLSLLYLGGLSNNKGVHTLLEAMRHLKHSRNQIGITFDLVGGGHEDQVRDLCNFVSVHKLEGCVTFHSWMPHARIPEFVRSRDALVFPSECHEALPRTPMEAMLCNLPVIGTLTGGTAELLQSEVNALTFEAGDPIGLAKQIERLAWDPALAQCLADAGRRTVLERFTLGRMVNEIESFLEQIMSTRFSAVEG